MTTSGKVFERETSLKFLLNDRLVNCSGSKLFKYLHSKNRLNKDIKKSHGCKSPDECYIDETRNIIFIIEKKYQKVKGSACEKIQTPDFKIWQYQRTFPDYNIVYIYCLSDWFKTNCIAELEYLKYKKIRYFFGNSINYKDYNNC